VVFPLCDQPAVVLHPGKEPFDFPAAAVAALWPSVLGLLFAVGPAGRDHLDSVFTHLLVQCIRVVGLVADQPFGQLVEEASGRTASTSRHSAGEAPLTDTARGRPSPEAIATILGPLPRLVGPTVKPPFWRSQRLHPRTLRPNAAFLAYADVWPSGAAPPQTCLCQPIAESAGGRSGREDTWPASSTAPPTTIPKATAISNASTAA